MARYAEAERAYLEAIKLRPDYDTAMGNLSLVYAKQERFDLAIAYAEKALNMFPPTRLRRCHRRMTCSCLRRNQWDRSPSQRRRAQVPVVQAFSPTRVCGNASSAFGSARLPQTTTSHVNHRNLDVSLALYPGERLAISDSLVARTHLSC